MLLNCGVGEDSWESLGLQGDPTSSSGNQSWIFIGRTDAEAETSIVWPPDAKNWLIRKDPDAGKDWRQEEKGTTEDEMVGWHHQLNAHEFEYTLGVGDEQGGLACCGPWGCKELDMTKRLNWTELLSLDHLVVHGCLSVYPLLSEWSFLYVLLEKKLLYPFGVVMVEGAVEGCKKVIVNSSHHQG